MRDFPEETLSDLETALRAEKAALEEELSELGKKTGADLWEASTSLSDESSDPEDAANHIEGLVTNAPLVKELEARYKNVKEALKKMKSGTYGYCEECSKEIPLDRLDGNAAARTCVAHAERSQ